MSQNQGMADDHEKGSPGALTKQLSIDKGFEKDLDTRFSHLVKVYGSVTAEFEDSIKRLWRVIPNQEETPFPALIQKIPSWASGPNEFQFFSTARCSYNRVGFEADDLARLFRVQDRISEVQGVLDKFSDQAKTEQMKILALQLRVNTTMFLGSDSLANLEAVWSFSKGDGDLEIMIGITSTNGVVFKIQPFLAQVIKNLIFPTVIYLTDKPGGLHTGSKQQQSCHNSNRRAVLSLRLSHAS
jgi:hypothetical protein